VHDLCVVSIAHLAQCVLAFVGGFRSAGQLADCDIDLSVRVVAMG
jgi:hypothetical protein